MKAVFQNIFTSDFNYVNAAKTRRGIGCVWVCMNMSFVQII